MEAGLSVAFMLVLLALAVPFWVVMGLGTVVLLLATPAVFVHARRWHRAREARRSA